MDVHIDSGISVLGAFCQARGYEVPAGATNPFFLGIRKESSLKGPLRLGIKVLCQFRNNFSEKSYYLVFTKKGRNQLENLRFVGTPLKIAGRGAYSLLLLFPGFVYKRNKWNWASHN